MAFLESRARQLQSLVLRQVAMLTTVSGTALAPNSCDEIEKCGALPTLGTDPVLFELNIGARSNPDSARTDLLTRGQPEAAGIVGCDVSLANIAEYDGSARTELGEEEPLFIGMAAALEIDEFSRLGTTGGARRDTSLLHWRRTDWAGD